MFVILDKNGNIKKKITLPTSMDYRAAPTVFDLNGDGKPEVLINTEWQFTIYDGKTWTKLYSENYGDYRPFGSQNIVIADVDDDGHAEAVGVGGDSEYGYGSLRVYKAQYNDWVRAPGASGTGMITISRT